MPTTRDEVWTAVLTQLSKSGEFQVSDLGLDTSKRHTVYRVLREMEDIGWLIERDTEPRTWKAGEVARRHLNLPMEDTTGNR